MPSESSFHRRIFGFLARAFQEQGWQVTGQCKLLPENEMCAWVRDNKPDVVFEMNRVKNEIPVLDEMNVMHISWLVDMGGRSESQIKGSEITYFIDPGWEFSFNTGGYTAWMPPGTCTQTFLPGSQSKTDTAEFSFIGHIPKPWSRQELNRVLSDKVNSITFESLLNEYMKYMEVNTYFGQTHESCAKVIDNIAEKLLGEPVQLAQDIYYDLLIRTKRISNRVELIDFAVRNSSSINIYGTENWLEWSKFSRFYKGFVEKESEINRIHQCSQFNMHDGISFHFRSIDCMASGALLLWYNTNDGDKFNIYKGKISSNGPGKTLGLSNFFEYQYHYYEFTWLTFNEVYEKAKSSGYLGSKAQADTIKLINDKHTWDCRVKRIIEDINSL